ncbi:Podocalyxin-like protein 2 [Bagarius yarrelli]|uniref:Podocalyxin-like protein 2 n=1 Tax=Bagarius yarrelli TaxID=175774 RepID=A0A556U3V3_BAGYA|nr:Podocalyxin-like protein 2 [Bagarius yarrelli]
MPGTPLHHLIIGFSLVLITLSKGLDGSPTSLSGLSASFQPIPDVSVGLEEQNSVRRNAENSAIPNLGESSQESSGYFSEDSEENKGPVALRKGDVQTEPNTSMDADSLMGVIATKDVLSMLGEVRRELNEIGVQNFSSVSMCHSRPSQTRSDYGKLFVVLVIIGSVCVIIIASGLIYICWQRRLPKMKSMVTGTGAWQSMSNKSSKDEEDNQEEDTHL